MGLTFAGYDFASYSVVVDSSDAWPKPERDRTVVHVPGRNGDLILDNGCWLNMEIKYRCLIKDDFDTKYPVFCEMLYSLKGYHELIDDTHPGVYRMAEFSGPLDPDLWFTNKTGVFDIKFNCKPQLYINPPVVVDLDFTTANDSETIDNPYFMDAYPLIKVYSQGGASLSVAGWTVAVGAQSTYAGILIDCAAEVCAGIDALGTVQGNGMQYVTFTPPASNPDQRDFPFIPTGTGIVISATHSSSYSGTAEVQPRLTRI